MKFELLSVLLLLLHACKQILVLGSGLFFNTDAGFFFFFLLLSRFLQLK